MRARDAWGAKLDQRITVAENDYERGSLGFCWACCPLVAHRYGIALSRRTTIQPPPTRHMCVAKPSRSTVVYDPDALLDFLTGVRSKEERKAAFIAVDKLRRVGNVYIVLAVAKDRRTSRRRNALPRSEGGSTPESGPDPRDKTFVIMP